MLNYFPHSTFDNDDMKSSKRQVTFLSLIFLLKCLFIRLFILGFFNLFCLLFVRFLFVHLFVCLFVVFLEVGGANRVH